MSNSYDTIYNNSFPTQKLPFIKKTEKWGKQVIETAEEMAIFRDPLIRKSYLNKQINFNLYNDILSTSDIEKVCNQYGFDSGTFPAKMQNYPLVVPKIDTLLGEERNRRFDWQVQVINDEAISEKEINRKEEFKKFIERKVTQNEPLDKTSLEREIDRFKNYMNYEWQDMVERRATHILKYLYQNLHLEEKFNRGFEDLLIAGEEIYCIDIEAGNPVVRKVNTLNLHTLRSGESPWINDADIILEDGYYSQGHILDKYHEELTDSQVKLIENGFGSDSDAGSISIGERDASFMIDSDLSQLIDTEDEIRNSGKFGGAYDNEGNIRVMRVVWKSKRKIGKLTYFDEDGNKLEKIVDESYKKKAGEEIKWVWINEWWEGTRIGGGAFNSDRKAIYLKIQRRPIQFRSIHNISSCHSGYVGIAYNTNVSKSKSLMDRMKPYQYLYNVFMYRTELAFAKAKGRIGKLDLSKMPKGWSVEQWMHYAEVNGWLIEDSFNEGVKGAAQGKLAGGMSGAGTYIDLDLGNYIQQHVMMLQFIEDQLGQIAGISRQREGNIQNRETVRGVERAIFQSNNITEKYFGVHDQVKTQVMEILLETAKFAWRGKKRVLQYVTDDLSQEIFTIEADDDVLHCDAGVVITSGSNTMELLSSLKELAHAGIQNDKITFQQLMDIYMNPDITSIRRKIEMGEMKKDAENQRQQEQAQKMQQEQLAAMSKENEAQRAFEMSKIDKEYAGKMAIEQFKAQAKYMTDRDLDNDGIDDQIEAEREATKKNIAELKARTEQLLQSQKLQHESVENEKDRKSAEKIASKRTTSTTGK